MSERGSSTRCTPARRWTFTLNNYTSTQVDSIKEFIQRVCTYGVFGYEGDRATPHLQGFVALRICKRLDTIKRELGIDQIHLEKARNDVATNRQYCTKSGNFWENGSPPSYRAGNDSEQMSVSTSQFINHMESCAPLKEYMYEFPKGWLLYGTTMLNNYYAAQHEITRPNILAIWIHGPTGVGKSRLAHELCPDAYRKMPNSKWWHRYKLQKDVIVDDLNLDAVDVSYWLRWLDRYPCSVETKGAEAPLHADLFILTSNYHPLHIFRTNSDALLRRLSIYEVNTESDFTTIRQHIVAYRINALVDPENLEGAGTEN